MLKIGLALAVLLGIGLLLFPQLRVEAIVLLPFAPLGLCFLMCCPMMYFGMRGMGNNDHNESENKK